MSAAKKARVALSYEPPVKLARYRTSLITYVNGKRHELDAIQCD